MKILITGDSFAADWVSSAEGWVNYLAKDYNITNLAQAGCGEYKIYLQLRSVDLSNYDGIIISHTSPYRWYTSNNLLHNNSNLHKQSDYIYNDIVGNIDKNPLLPSLKTFFENFYDLNYAVFVHNLVCKEIENLVLSFPTIHLSFFDYKTLHKFNNFLDLSKIFEKHRGSINHLNSIGNSRVYDIVKNKLKDLNL